MRILIANFAGIILISSFAMAQDPTPGYYLIYGNRNGSNVDVNIDSDIKIEVWAATPPDSVNEVFRIHMPLSSNDSIIDSRNGGEVFYPLNLWATIDFFSPNPDSIPGFTNQSLHCYANFPRPYLITDGDSIHIASLYMHTALDTSLINETICPFIEGYHPGYGGLWWVGYDPWVVYPLQTFSCLNFVDYLPGDANSSGEVNGLDVIYMVGYLKGYFPPPDPIFAGDANGDCLANGLDVIYLVAYFKGTGPAPFLGNCH